MHTRHSVSLGLTAGLAGLLAPIPLLAHEPQVMEKTTITGRADSLLNIADAASEGYVGQDHLEYRPLLRAGEVLETIPGVIVTQHSGSGKANQYFARGFNLDHGTDFATSVDGVPVNLPTHAHGQGYTDLNFLIPELVDTVHYRKGPYYADVGDFGSAGAADISYANDLGRSLLELSGGSFGYGRMLYASSPKVGEGNLLYAVELSHDDGPWERPQDYQKVNGVLRYSQEKDGTGYSISAMAYAGKWNSSDQIAARAAPTLAGGRLGEIDPTDGGDSHRVSLSAEWHRETEAGHTQIEIYGVYYNLDLFSD
ncbi:MAG TPA: TonB-dependent receptor plug domain-containing protein, partial [Candidatus Limnocylindria bacterium]|nr:TonB-dependent receptor plug domain-containing protein [Candidatus Limnocylindria bacterium]